MFKHIKEILALALTLVLCAGSVVPAMAEETVFGETIVGGIGLSDVYVIKNDKTLWRIDGTDYSNRTNDRKTTQIMTDIIGLSQEGRKESRLRYTSEIFGTKTNGSRVSISKNTRVFDEFETEIYYYDGTMNGYYEKTDYLKPGINKTRFLGIQISESGALTATTSSEYGFTDATHQLATDVKYAVAPFSDVESGTSLYYVDSSGTLTLMFATLPSPEGDIFEFKQTLLTDVAIPGAPLTPNVPPQPRSSATATTDIPGATTTIVKDVSTEFTPITPAYKVKWPTAQKVGLLSVKQDAGTYVAMDANGNFTALSRSNGTLSAMVANGDVVQFFQVTGGTETPIPAYTNIDFIKYAVNKQNNAITGYSGFIPDPINLYGGGGAAGTSGSAAADISNPYNSAYADKFDPRSEAWFPAVKNQQQTNLCWDFSAISAIEVLLGKSNNTRYDFSESNAAYALSKEGSAGFNRGILDAGSFKMNMAYMGRMDGPLNEADDPFTNALNGKAGIGKPVASVLGFEQIPYGISKVKDSLSRYGSAITSMYVSDSKASAFYNPKTSAYYMADASITPNHAIQIVGWDNKYSANNFTAKPPIDGAWIVKNSWGTDSGDKGYNYISYADNTIAKQIYVVTDIDSNPVTETIYSYDPFGETGQLHFNTKSVWFANVFSAKQKNEKISKVAFYSSNPDSNYEIWISPDGDLNKKEEVKSGKLETVGYFTIPLGKDIPVDENFAVLVKITSPEAATIPVEKNIPRYVESATAAKGQSFISSDGKKWIDLTDKNSDANVCVRAIAVGEPKIAHAIIIDGKIVEGVKFEMVDGRTFVPLRMVSESLSQKVEWDQESATVTVVGKFTHVVGSNSIMTVDGVTKTIDVNSYIKDNRTMVSIRLFTEALGYKVEYESQNQNVIITTK